MRTRSFSSALSILSMVVACGPQAPEPKSLRSRDEVRAEAQRLTEVGATMQSAATSGRLVVLGDSIAAGTLADTKLGQELGDGFRGRLSDGYLSYGLQLLVRAMRDETCPSLLIDFIDLYVAEGRDTYRFLLKSSGLKDPRCALGQLPMVELVSSVHDTHRLRDVAESDSFARFTRDAAAGRLDSLSRTGPEAFDASAMSFTRPELAQIADAVVPNLPLAESAANYLSVVRRALPRTTYVDLIFPAIASGLTDVGAGDFSRIFDNEGANAFSGSQATSLASYLRERTTNLQIANLAIAGAYAADLVETGSQVQNPAESGAQVARLRESYAAGEARADVIVFEFGANDQMFATEPWHIGEDGHPGGMINGYRRALDEIGHLQAGHATTVLVIATPDPYMVRDAIDVSRATAAYLSIDSLTARWPGVSDSIADTPRYAEAAADGRLALFCSDSYDAYAKVGVLRRSGAPVVATSEINRRLRALIDELEGQFEGVTFKFVADAFDGLRNAHGDLDATLLAADCYHPGARGHRELAAKSIKALAEVRFQGADLTGDGYVDAADVELLLEGWGQSGAADLTGDGVVDAADAARLFQFWGQ